MNAVRWKRFPVLAPVVAVLCCLLLGGLAMGQDKVSADNGDPLAARLKPPTAAQKVEIGKGQTLFRANCAFCHGPDATGASGPDLMHSKIVNDDEGGNLIGQVVGQGRPGKMPVFHLTEEQIHQIAAFLHERLRVSYTPYGVLPQNMPAQRLLVGNAADGKAYFFGAGGCSHCHSPEGDLKGVASRLTPLKLQNSIVYPENDQQQVTITWPDGHQAKGPLVYADDFYVSWRTPDGWTQTIARSGPARIAITDPLAGHAALIPHYTNKDLHDLFAFLETLK